MIAELPSATEFSFVRRPVPVPGDLRIAWRLPVILLMLAMSRGKRASLAKLHILNGALRSSVGRVRLSNIVTSATPASSWQIRVEPALGRAIDFLIGAKLAQWTEVSKRIGLELTVSGTKAAEQLLKLDDALNDEREFLKSVAGGVTEGLVSAVIGSRKVI